MNVVQLNNYDKLYSLFPNFDKYNDYLTNNKLSILLIPPIITAALGIAFDDASNLLFSRITIWSLTGALTGALTCKIALTAGAYVQNKI